MNKILTNTLEYKELLKILAYSVLDGTTQDKLREFTEVAEEESKNLTLFMSDLGGGGEVNSTGLHTDQEAVGLGAKTVV